MRLQWVKCRTGLFDTETTGLLYDRFGHRVTSAIAAVLVGGGYLLSYVSVKEIWWNSPFWVLVIFYVLIGQGSYGINISALDINIKNFSKQDRGKVLEFYKTLLIPRSRDCWQVVLD